MIRLANNWSQARDVHILCGSAEGPSRALVAPDVTVHEMRPAIARSPLSRIRLGKAIAKHLPSIEPDVIVGPGNHLLPVIATLGETRAPIVCKLSNPLDLPAEYRVPRGLLRWATARACRSVNALIAMSPALAAEAAKIAHAKEIRVVAEPIDVRPGLFKKTGEKQAIRILYAGRLVRQKSVAAVITAMTAMPADTELNIAGDGPDFNNLKALAKRLRVASRTRFLGRVDCVKSVLSDADLLVLPSLYEGYPAVLVEAITAGVPVVTTACSPAISEILCHSSFGIVSRQYELAASIMRAADLRVDVSASAALAQRHNINTSASSWLRTLDEIAGRILEET